MGNIFPFDAWPWKTGFWREALRAPKSDHPPRTTLEEDLTFFHADCKIIMHILTSPKKLLNVDKEIIDPRRSDFVHVYIHIISFTFVF